MDGSPSAIVSLGYGPWGSVGLVVTLGFGIGEVVVADPGGYVRATPGGYARVGATPGGAARVGATAGGSATVRATARVGSGEG
jgi:hypothetical protein